MNRVYAWLVSAVMFTVGACGLVYEYALGVLGNNLIGSAHEQIFVIIGLMLFAMGVGAAAQQGLKRNLLDAFLLVEILLAALGGASVLVVYTAYAVLVSYQVVLFAVAGAIGVLIGAEIPLILRLREDPSLHGRLPEMSTVLSVDYLGSLAGALAFAYLLIPSLSLDRIVVVLGLINLVVAVVCLSAFRQAVARPRLLVVAAVSAGLVLAAVARWSRPAMAALEQRTFADPIVLSTSSRYQHLVLTRRGEDLRLYLNGQLQFSASDEYIYHELLVHAPLRLAASRRRVLILGGGDGLAAREVLKYPDVETVTLVDLDPLVTNLAAAQADLVALNQGSLVDARLVTRLAPGLAPGATVAVERQTHLHRSQHGDQRYRLAEVAIRNVDADVFVRATAGTYDAVVIDFPDPGQLELCKLYSRDFFRALRQRLAPGAVLSIQSTSPWHAPLVYHCIGATLESAGFRILPYLGHVPSFGGWGWHLAWTDEVTPEQMRQRLGNETQPIPVPTRHVTPAVLAASCVIPPDILARRQGVGVNTKMRPLILGYFRRSWSR